MQGERSYRALAVVRNENRIGFCAVAEHFHTLEDGA